MKTGSVGTDVREFLAVVGVATAGLALAAAAAFMPWYGPVGGDPGDLTRLSQSHALCRCGRGPSHRHWHGNDGIHGPGAGRYAPTGSLKTPDWPSAAISFTASPGDQECCPVR